MKCSHCGGFLDETDKRCPYCNAVNENYKAPEPEKPAEPVASAPVAPQVIHIYHDAPKPQEQPKAQPRKKKPGIPLIVKIIGIVAFFFFVTLPVMRACFH